MERVIFVEQLDRHGRVVARVRAELSEDAPAFRIGSGYENDLILDDPYVEPAHAVIEMSEAGGLQLRDLETHNGCVLLAARTTDTAALRKTKARARTSECSGVRIPLGAEALVQIGRSRLRLRDESYTPLPARRLAIHSRPVAWLLEHWSAPLLFFAFCVSVLLATDYRRSFAEFEWSELLSVSGMWFLFLVAWVCVWSLINLFVRGEHRFGAHAVIVFGTAGALRLCEIPIEWSRFLSPYFEAPRFLELGLSALALFFVLFAQLSVVGVDRRMFRTSTAALFVSLFLAFRLVTYAEREPDWVTTLPYWSRLEPLHPRWIAPTPAAEYFNNLAALQREADEAARDD